VTLQVGAEASRCAARSSLSFDRVQIELVNLLGTRVGAWASLNRREHERRNRLALGAITDPNLLDRLLDLPLGEIVDDPVAWTETVDQPEGIVERSEDCCTIRRLLEPPLVVSDVFVSAQASRAVRAVQDASLFASYASRWVVMEEGPPPEYVVMEAKLCGVGLLDRERHVLLRAEPPVVPVIDGWTWLFWEKAYRRWLKELSLAREMASPAPAIDEATEVQTD